MPNNDQVPAVENPTLDADRLTELEGMVPLIDDPSDPLLTVGFTIDGVFEKISNSLIDPAVLGWFFMLKTKVKNPETEEIESVDVANIEGIPIMELRLENGLLSTASVSARIRPAIVRQEKNPGTGGANDSHQQAILNTKTTFNFVQSLPVTDLSYHTDWAEAVFLRR
ncbi:MAG: hypothetical protein AAGF89_11190, partial [Bacteroidota bacterium]